MMKHEDTPHAQSSPAAQVRVTPEELAAAITALQLRKEGQPGTIAIGDAVDELGLDVTPEEVLAEVQTRRQLKPKKPRSRTWDRAVLALGLVGITLGFAADRDAFLHLRGGSGVAQVSRTLPPISLTAAPNLTVSNRFGKIMMLSEVGNDQPVRCAFDSSSSTFASYLPYGPSWTLIKHGGRLYVRGWMMQESAELIKYYGVDVRTTNANGVGVPVTFSIDSLKVVPGASDGQRLQSKTVDFDRHAYEKW